MSRALHRYITGGGDGQPSVNTEQPRHTNDVSVTNVEHNTCINVTRNRLDDDIISGILSGATFNGQVVINFNISK